MFSRSSKKLIEEVGKLNPSITFSVNSEKPGKGNFVVSVGRVEVVALKAMPRPFKALRELDLEKTAATLVKTVEKQ